MSCAAPGAQCSGNFTDLTGQRAMGYYDEDFLNYYYYMASQFSLSDRWFSPVSTKSIGNRVATFTGGTTQGLVKDPGGNDHLPQLDIPNIFQELDQANVTWKIYYTVTQGFCLNEDDCSGSATAAYPATNFSTLTYSTKYIYENPTGAACVAPTQPSSVVGDTSNSFCIDPTHITPLSTYFADVANGTLPSFAFIEAGYGNNDEHPGSGQSILTGQAQVANVINTLMTSQSWKDSVFFFSYDEGGGPYDHVPPVPGHSNDKTTPSLGTIPDISTIAVNPDQYNPCVPQGGVATTHCDLGTTDPGANPADAAATQGRGNLEADEACADHDCALGRFCPGNDRSRIGERAQHVHVRLISAGDIEAQRLGAGCEQQLVEGDASSTWKRHLASLRIDAGDVAAKLKFDRLVLIKLGRSERHPVFGRVPRKIVLRAIRPVIGGHLVGRDERHAAGKALSP